MLSVQWSLSVTRDHLVRDTPSCMKTCRPLVSSHASRGHQVPRKGQGVKKKLKRGKTFVHAMNINNMCRQSGGFTLKRFQVHWPKGQSLPTESPFNWAHVNFCEDRDSVNVCLDHALCYRRDDADKKFNAHTDYDLNHTTTLSSAHAIKRANKWRRHVRLRVLSPRSS